MTARRVAVLLAVLALTPVVQAAEWRFGPRAEIDPGAGFAPGAGVLVAYLPFEPAPGVRLGVSAHGGALWPAAGITWTGAAGLHLVYAPVFARLGWWGQSGGLRPATGPYLAIGGSGALDRALDWAIDASIGLDLLGAGTRIRVGAMLLLAR